jgi:ketosteroid isomerase-like protein
MAAKAPSLKRYHTPMKPLLISLLLIFALPAFAQNTPPSSNEDAATAINRLREGLVTSFKKGDIDTLLTYLDTDVVVTWQNGEVCRGPDAVRAFYQRMMKGEKPVVREIKSEPEVLGRQLHGDVAISWGNLHDHFVLTDGSDLPFNSVFTASIAKRGDRWLVTAFHTSVNVFENPVISYAMRKTVLWTGLGAGLVGIVLGWIIAGMASRKKANT